MIGNGTPNAQSRIIGLTLPERGRAKLAAGAEDRRRRRVWGAGVCASRMCVSPWVMPKKAAIQPVYVLSGLYLLTLMSADASEVDVMSSIALSFRTVFAFVTSSPFSQ